MTRSNTSSNRMRHFHSCGTGLWLYASQVDDTLSLRCSCCHDRMCDACARTRGRTIQQVLEGHLKGRFTRFLTFTLKHNRTPLRDQIQRLYTCFATLRRRKLWRQHVTGGCAFLEVKLGRDTLWHVHIHVLCEGSFWDQRSICSEWHCVTGDSYIVDIQAKGDDASKARYCTKYVTKPCSDDVFNSEPHLDEFLAAIKGRRLITKFGTWSKLDLADEDSDDRAPWIPLGSLSQLAANAKGGDLQSRRYLEAALLRWPNLADYVPHPTPTDFDAAPP